MVSQGKDFFVKEMFCQFLAKIFLEISQKYFLCANLSESSKLLRKNCLFEITCILTLCLDF